MATAARNLTEPHVLAHTKRRLFPDDEAENTYVVVDTQFATDRWLAGERLDEEVTDVLSPFNHVEVGGGYPDLVGVRALDDDLLAVERFGDDPPLVAVEAKGYTERGRVDVERGVVQAYDRLHEANVAYAAAPTSAVSQSARTLARELNVGLLGVTPGGAVEPLETPRLVGSRTTTETSAIRFQASAQGVANKSFGLNHPKNYLGYPLALYADGPTADHAARKSVRTSTKSVRRTGEIAFDGEASPVSMLATVVPSPLVQTPTDLATSPRTSTRGAGSTTRPVRQATLSRIPITTTGVNPKAPYA